METNLHFLRPELLLLLFLVPGLMLLMRRGVTLENTWAQHINPDLLNALQGHSGQKKRTARTSVVIAIVASLLIVAASGPSWQERAKPVTKIVENITIVLDLSLSMLAEDTPPSRLVRAKQKIVDLLRYRTEGSTALIAFSGDSFVVTPLTDDTRTIESNLAALGPLLMPVIGSRADLAITQAIEVFENSSLNSGRIILVTDGVAPHQANSITEQLSRTKYSLNVIAVGTESGAPIPLPNDRGYLQDNGAIVIPKTDLSQLERLALENDGVFSELTLSDADLEALSLTKVAPLNRQEVEDDTAHQDQLKFDQWEDMGFIFLAVALPLCLIAYRQGALLVLLIMVLPETGSAFELSDLWQTKDQQAYAKQQAGDYEAAAELYSSQTHKADALYRAGKYEEAAKLYGEQSSAIARFNRGNSLAKANRFKEAIEAYEEALEIDPNLSDAVYNKKLVEQIQQQQEQQNGSNDQKSDQNDQQSESGDSNQESTDQNSESNKQQTNSDNANEQNSSNDGESSQDQSQEASQQSQPKDQEGSSQQSGQPSNDLDDQSKDSQTPQTSEDIKQRNEQQRQQADQPQSAKQDGSEPSASETTEGFNSSEFDVSEDPNDEPLNDGSMAIEGELSSEEQQSYEQWMRRVPDDPSGLLRRKFEQQSRQRSRESNPEEPLW